MVDEETRGFWQAQDAEEEDDGWHGSEAEHQAPCHRLRQVLEQEVDDVRKQHARDDHRLVDAREAAAQMSRCHFRHVSRDESRSRADGEAQEDADADEIILAVVRSDTRENRADNEDECGDENHLAAAEAIRELAGECAAKDSAEHDGRCDPADDARIALQVPIVLQERQGSCHDADIITEEDAAEGSEEVNECTGDFLLWRIACACYHFFSLLCSSFNTLLICVRAHFMI